MPSYRLPATFKPNLRFRTRDYPEDGFDWTRPVDVISECGVISWRTDACLAFIGHMIIIAWRYSDESSVPLPEPIEARLERIEGALCRIEHPLKFLDRG